ncbi:hypothetical protein [Tundra vole stool-associated circular virus]|nr:hypothetical protein [Tundra vole stool-associated circular virus]
MLYMFDLLVQSIYCYLFVRCQLLIMYLFKSFVPVEELVVILLHYHLVELFGRLFIMDMYTCNFQCSQDLRFLVPLLHFELVLVL